MFVCNVLCRVQSLVSCQLFTSLSTLGFSLIFSLCHIYSLSLCTLSFPVGVYRTSFPLSQTKAFSLFLLCISISFSLFLYLSDFG